MPPLLGLHTEYLVQLGNDDDKGRGIGKANDDRTGQQIDQQAQPQRAHGNSYQADQQAQGQRIGDIQLAALGNEPLHGRRADKRSDGHRAGGQMPGRAKERGYGRRQKGRVQPINRWQPRQLGVGHGLGHEDRRHGKARDHIGAPDAWPAEFGQPMDKWKKSLHAFARGQLTPSRQPVYT